MKTLCAILITLLMACPLWAGDAGTTSANFLKLGAGPRAISMGDAQVAIADDVYATYWNPAGLSQLETQQAGFTYTQYLEDINQQYLAYAYPSAKLGTFATSLSYLTVGQFQGFDAVGQPTSQVGANDIAWSLCYANSLWRDRRYDSTLSAGFTAKWINEKLDTISAQAYAVDAGLFYAPGRKWGEMGQGFKAGVTIRNLGTSMKFDQESFALPRVISLGGSWTGSWLSELVTVAVDGEQPNDGASFLNAGLELWTLQTFVARAGYSAQGDLGNGLRLGVGIRFRTFEFDYAYGNAGNFGSTQRIGVTLRFSRPPENVLSLAEDWYEKGLKDYKKERFTEALVEFNKALEIDPSHPRALDMMHQTYDKLKDNAPQ